jgi:hypothetical protein
MSKREVRPRRSEVEYLDMEAKFDNIGKRISRERKPFFEYKQEPEQRRPGGETYRKVYNLLKNLKNHPKSGPFLQPVDTILYPEYLSIITEPIDLESIENRLDVGYYKNTSELGMDIRRIWGNSYQYNAQNPEMYQATIEMSQFFELNFRTMENLPLNDIKTDTVHDLKKKVEKMNATIENLKSKPLPPKKPSVTM